MSKEKGPWVEQGLVWPPEGSGVLEVLELDERRSPPPLRMIQIPASGWGEHKPSPFKNSPKYTCF